MHNLITAISEFALEPENVDKNYVLGRIYEDMGQTAAAISYLLRTAERTEDNELAYECLIRVGNCFDRQGNRHNTVRGIYKHAIRFLPNRPEAYYLLAKFDNYYQNHQDGYYFSHVGLETTKQALPELRGDVGYPGTYGLMLEKATSGWLWGKREECKELLDAICANYWSKLSQAFRDTVNSCYDNFKFERPSIKLPIVDCFTYYDETCKEMLELRYNMLKDHVQKFVVCEANRTQTGEPIQRRLRDTLQELNLPMDKFVIVDVDIPEDSALEIQQIDKLNSYQNDNEVSYMARARERLQKNGLHQVLNKFDDNTYFIVSDCDEIINPINLEHILYVVEQNQDKIIKIPLMHMEGRANLRVVYKNTWSPKIWDGAMFICKKRHLERAEVIQIRSNIDNPFAIAYIYDKGVRVEDLGWHFSWMGDSYRRKKKLNGFVHRNEKLDFLETGSYDSAATLERMESEPVAGAISVSCEANTILVPYPEGQLPSAILQNPKLYDFFIGKNSENKEQILKILEEEYERAATTITDIYKHLPVLRNYAKECTHITEMGVRTGQSTRALLVEPVTLRSYDLSLDADVSKLFALAQQAGKDVQYIEGNTLQIQIDETDLLFIDTEHSYVQLSAELELHHHKVRKYIAFHDTDKPFAEELLPAIIEFMIRHPGWEFCYHSKECHGFTVIKRR